MESREEVARKQAPYVLKETHLDFLSSRYEGKVRDSYCGKKYRYLITTDRISCFDVMLGAVPFKGQVLNELASYWFEKTAHIATNHIVAQPDPNVMVVKNVDILPIEVVVRAYIAGSAWRDYEAGRPVSGISLPSGLQPHAKLPELILTPSTKAEKGGHDEPISEAEILERGIVERNIWEQVREKAFALFRFASQEVAKRGLLLVDTKYEFGLLDGEVILADEIHTLDSSRYWVAESYEKRFAEGISPEMLDKEPVRQWLISQGYMGEGTPPAFPEKYVQELSLHYMLAFDQISGRTFHPVVGDAAPRIAHNLREYEELFLD